MCIPEITILPFIYWYWHFCMLFTAISFSIIIWLSLLLIVFFSLSCFIFYWTYCFLLGDDDGNDDLIEPRKDEQQRPLSTASFYQQHYYQPGSSYSPLTVGASLPDSSRNSSRLGHFDQSSISEPTLTSTNPTSTSQKNTNFSNTFNYNYNNYNQKSCLTSTNQPSSIDLPHFNLLSFASNQHSLPKYRDFNSSPRGFIRSTG